MFELGIAFAGQAPTTTIEQNPTSVSITAPSLATGAAPAGKSSEKPLPSDADVTFDLICGGTPQLYLTKPGRNSGHFHGASYGGHSVRIDRSHETAYPGGPQVTAAVTPIPSSLSSLSPPGLIQRL
jgi:hypothetical protein